MSKSIHEQSNLNTESRILTFAIHRITQGGARKLAHVNQLLVSTLFRLSFLSQLMPSPYLKILNHQDTKGPKFKKKNPIERTLSLILIDR